MEAYIRESALSLLQQDRWRGIMVNEVLEDGFVRNHIDVPQAEGNFYDNVYGGFLMSIVDTAGCMVPWTYGKFVVTQAADIHFLAGAKVGDRLIAEGRSLHCGSSSAVSDVRVCDSKGNLCVQATVTMHITGPITPDGAVPEVKPALATSTR